MKSAAYAQYLVLVLVQVVQVVVLSIFNLLLTRLSSTSGSDVELGRARPIPLSASR